MATPGASRLEGIAGMAAGATPLADLRQHVSLRGIGGAQGEGVRAGGRVWTQRYSTSRSYPVAVHSTVAAGQVAVHVSRLPLRSRFVISVSLGRQRECLEVASF